MRSGRIPSDEKRTILLACGFPPVGGAPAALLADSDVSRAIVLRSTRDRERMDRRTWASSLVGTRCKGTRLSQGSGASLLRPSPLWTANDNASLRAREPVVAHAGQRDPVRWCRR